MADCLFCRIVKKEIPSKIFFEDEDLVVFHDINPKAPVHLLIVPKKHLATVNDLEEEDRTLAGKMILAAQKAAKKAKIAQKGYRLVFNCGQDGGQEIGHLHLHLLGGKRLIF